MSLLAPLYIAGLLAISLPIIFHLIRRTPHGRQPFTRADVADQDPDMFVGVVAVVEIPTD